MWYALVIIIGWGISFFLLRIPITQVGPVLTTLWFAGLLVPFFAFSFLWQKYEPVQRSVIPWFFFIAFFSAIAALAFSFGLELGPVSVVVPVESSAPLVAVLVSYLFLKERLDFNQKISIGLIILGIITVSL